MPPRPHPSAPPEVVPAGWLVRAFLLTTLVALLCGYFTFCLLFAQGQWQLVLHPSRAAGLPALIADVATQPVRFGPDASGQPKLAGIWIPADPAGRYRHLTLLYLADGDGSTQDAVAKLAALRELGMSVFAFDYRGYGASAPGHPSQARMEADAESALAYLVSTRNIPESRIILYGTGVGGFLAAQLATLHPAIPALIIDAPRFHIEQAVRRDPRVRLLPVRLLFHEAFPVAPLLDKLATPKLILSRSSAEAPEVHQAADPKMTVALPETGGPGEFTHTLARFLDQYAPPTPVSSLLPAKAP